MKKTCFSQYIDDINDIIKEARLKHDRASIELERATKNSEKAIRDNRAGTDKRIIAEAQKREAEAEYRKSVHAIQEEADAAIKALRKSLEKHIMEYVAADPEKVDQGAVVLLNSGVMREWDFLSLANKFGDNPTMLNLIAGVASKEMPDSRGARYLAEQIREHITPAARMSLFDEANRLALRTIQDDGNMAGRYQKLWDENFYGTLKKNMGATETFKMEVE